MRGKLRPPRVRVGALCKLALDVTVAITLIAVTLPLVAVVALAIKADSRGPVFYRVTRVGRRGREFGMLKFRKMADGAAGPALTAHDDERFTRVGRRLAQLKLDELPQLWNVLRGDMSVVGPRPQDPGFVVLGREADEQILTVKPGITGLTQLAFAREGEILDPADRVGDYVRRLFPQKIALDQLYARRRTLALDLRILGWTAAVVLLRRDVAVDRETAAIGLRQRRAERRDLVPETVEAEA